MPQNSLRAATIFEDPRCRSIASDRSTSASAPKTSNDLGIPFADLFNPAIDPGIPRVDQRLPALQQRVPLLRLQIPADDRVVPANDTPIPDIDMDSTCFRQGGPYQRGEISGSASLNSGFIR